jgi:hypothetical protein
MLPAFLLNITKLSYNYEKIINLLKICLYEMLYAATYTEYYNYLFFCPNPSKGERLFYKFKRQCNV